MKVVVEVIGGALVEVPDAVEVRELESGAELELRVADADFDQVVGHRGETAHAIRTLLSPETDGARPVNLRILDPDESPAE